jgi:hypothetical protein
MNALLLSSSKETKAKYMKLLKSYFLGLFLLSSHYLLNGAISEGEQKVSDFEGHVIALIGHKEGFRSRPLIDEAGKLREHKFKEFLYKAICTNGTLLIASYSKPDLVPDYTIVGIKKDDESTVTVYACNDSARRAALYKKMKMLYRLAAYYSQEQRLPLDATYSLSSSPEVPLHDHTINKLFQQGTNAGIAEVLQIERAKIRKQHKTF